MYFSFTTLTLSVSTMRQQFCLAGMTTSADNNDIFITMRCFGGIMSIVYLIKNIKSPSLLSQYLRNWHVLETDDGTHWDRITKQLIDPFLPMMNELAATLPTTPSDLLSDYLYPRVFALEATASLEAKEIAPHFMGETHQQDITPPGSYIPQVQGRLQELIVLKNKVLAGDKEYFFKQWHGNQLPGSANLRELATYRRIAESIAAGQIRPDLRVCRLHGVVMDDDRDTWLVDEEGGSRLVGILLTWVETERQPWLETLYQRANHELSPKTLSDWSDQLDALIAELRKAGIVWGDAKPQNILVDSTGNIWLIDFGGSYTEGWVDRQNKETKEGDAQGVQRIKAFLSERISNRLSGGAKSCQDT
ncbi:hypothetical protein F5Y17DRAFT_262875 [Xylariaceae sp. FL0594]|nr:hypothetical protein F5Y17DRAFT_262875 [Xylariaceae sp. FL0594]